MKKIITNDRSLKIESNDKNLKLEKDEVVSD